MTAPQVSDRRGGKLQSNRQLKAQDRSRHPPIVNMIQEIKYVEKKWQNHIVHPHTYDTTLYREMLQRVYNTRTLDPVTLTLELLPVWVCEARSCQMPVKPYGSSKREMDP